MGGKLFLGILFGAGLMLILSYLMLAGATLPASATSALVPLRDALWHYRALDVLGGLALLLTGTYGVLVLVRERR
ncbi:MAG TPA: hypothetical protein DGT21_04480 [Armatimonadetes bacterium]|jgi:hypothetical protein|nr:hypothetical protein [Armatimonadota bacterium]